MAGWRLRDDEAGTALLKAFGKLGLHETVAIAAAAHVDENVTVRLFKKPRRNINGENARRIFACLLGYINARSDVGSSAREGIEIKGIEVNDKLSPDQKRAVDDELQKYCVYQENEKRRNARPLPDAVHPNSDPVRPAGGDSRLSCMVVYARLVHLRDEESQKPVYRRFIARLGEEVDVYDELLITRTLLFKEEPKRLWVEGRRDKYTDLQPVYPPRTALFGHYIDREAGASRKKNKPLAGIVEHFEVLPGILWQGVFTMINAFQRGCEYVGSLVTEDCDRLVLVVDLTSLPVKQERLFIKDRFPTGYHLRAVSDGKEQRLRLPVEQSKMGAFILDTKKGFDTALDEPTWKPDECQLLEHDKYEVHFPINWDAVNEATNH